MTSFGGEAWGPPSYNGSAQPITFSGGQYVTLGSPPLLTSLTGDITLSVWVRTSIVPPVALLAGNWLTAGSNSYGLFWSISGDLSWAAGSSSTASATNIWGDNKWHQVVGVRSNGTLSLYVDGTVVGTLAGQPPASAAGAWQVGGGTGQWFYQGQVSACSIWNRALSLAEVQQDYVQGQGGHQDVLNRQPRWLLPGGTVVTESAAIAGKGSLTALPSVSISESAGITGTGTLTVTVTPSVSVSESTAVSATGHLTATPSVSISDSAALAIRGSLTAIVTISGQFQPTTVDFAMTTLIAQANLAQTIYPLHVPQQVNLPAYTYQRIYADRTYRLDGGCGIAQVRYQICSWSTLMDDVVNMSETMRSVLQGYVGTVGGVAIQFISLGNQHDSYDTPFNASDLGVYGRIDEYYVTYSESLPQH